MSLVTETKAYIDPGTGSFLIQALIGFVGAVIVFFRNPIAFIKNFYLRLKEKKNNKQNIKK